MPHGFAVKFLLKTDTEWWLTTRRDSVSQSRQRWPNKGKLLPAPDLSQVIYLPGVRQVDVLYAPREFQYAHF